MSHVVTPTMMPRTAMRTSVKGTSWRHFLFKPFRPGALARTVREALDERAPDAA